MMPREEKHWTCLHTWGIQTMASPLGTVHPRLVPSFSYSYFQSLPLSATLSLSAERSSSVRSNFDAELAILQRKDSSETTRESVCHGDTLFLFESSVSRRGSAGLSWISSMKPERSLKQLTNNPPIDCRLLLKCWNFCCHSLRGIFRLFLIFHQIETSKSLLHQQILCRLSGTSTLSSLLRLICFSCWFLLRMRLILCLVRRIRCVRYSAATRSYFIGRFAYFSFFFTFEVIRVFPPCCREHGEFIVSTVPTSFTLQRRIWRMQRTFAKTATRLTRARSW